MDIHTARQLSKGSAFWSPSKNTHDKSGWRLQVVIGEITNIDGFVTLDEHGYQSAWFFNSDRNLIATCKIDQPAGATEPDKIIEYYRSTGRL